MRRCVLVPVASTGVHEIKECPEKAYAVIKVIWRTATMKQIGALEAEWYSAISKRSQKNVGLQNLESRVAEQVRT
jgi:hypothetical protein